MSRHNEYTGETCVCGRPMYYRIVQLGGRPESRRGPSCWYEDCAEQLRWQEQQA